ncbi:Suppressor of disruption of TFIIS [Exophiala dermatitidis]
MSRLYNKAAVSRIVQSIGNCSHRYDRCQWLTLIDGPVAFRSAAIRLTCSFSSMGSVESLSPDKRAFFFFDIDNCLYAKSRNVHDYMERLINEYFVKHLDLSAEDAERLSQQYHKDYGLAIEGLVRHHKIDAMDFNRKVDDALPLDELLSPDPEIRQILETFDKSKVKMWLLTNAHITHGRRVVKLLEIEDLFEGITYCDYSAERLVPKPHPEMYAKAEREAGATQDTAIYYVDDAYSNCQAAYARGWANTVHLVEPGVPDPPVKACKYQISHLRELLGLFPELLKKKEIAP